MQSSVSGNMQSCALGGIESSASRSIQSNALTGIELSAVGSSESRCFNHPTCLEYSSNSIITR